MRKILVSGILFIIGMTTLQAQINFEEGTLEEVKQKAQATNKPIYLDAYTTWCGPCKWMDKEVFTDTTVGNYYNTHFVNYKLDMEKGEGIELRKQYGINTFPTMLYLQADGTLMYKAIGARAPASFLALGETALNPDNHLGALQKRYEAGERAPTFLKQYAKALINADEIAKATEIAAMYLSKQPNEALIKEEHFMLLAAAYTKLPEDKQGYVVQNKSGFAQNVGEEKAASFFDYVLTEKMEKAIRANNEAARTNLQGWFKKYLPEKEVAMMAYYDYLSHKGTDKAYHYAKIYFGQHCEDAEQLNSIAWEYYDKVEDTEKLEKAVEWGLKSVSFDEAHYNLDTVAHLYYKLGKYEQAQKAAQSAIRIGKENNRDVKGTEALLEKIEEKE